MTKYLIGNEPNMWNFFDAYRACHDGDILILNKNLSINVGENFEINKSISIEGNIEIRDKKPTYLNIIKGNIFVRKKAKLNLKSLWIESNKNQNILNADDEVSLTLENVVIVQKDMIKMEEKTKKYPEIFVKGTKLTLKNVTNFDSKDYYSEFFAKNSDIDIINSNIYSKLGLRDCNLSIKNSNVIKYYSNTINAYDSKITISNSTIKGGNSLKNFPEVFLNNSTLTSDDNKYEQDKYDQSIYLTNNSYIKSLNDSLSSLSLCDSRGIIEGAIIREVLLVYENSYLVSKGLVSFLGDVDEKVDASIENYSTFIAESALFMREVNPNIRLRNNSYFSIKDAKAGDDSSMENMIFKADKSSNYNIYSLEKSEKEDIENIDKDNNNPYSKELALNELNKLVGLTSVKNEINKMVRMVEFNKKRMEQGLSVEKTSLHSVFLGNPGTGKTTVARLIGRILFENGALYNKDEYIFIEATESDLISSFVGKTAEQTHKILEKARGGVLFIDEAYTLNKGDSSVNYGQEAINTILKYMEDKRDEIMIIFAGYTKEMEQFLETNPGLKSRVSNRFNFEDYTSDEIVEIGQSILANKEYTLEDVDYYKKNVAYAYESTLDKSNARWIRNFNEKLLKAFADRVIETGSDDFTTIKNEDIDEVFDSKKYQNYDQKDEDAYDKLNNLIGVNQVKDQVNEFISMAELNKRRRDQGQKVQSMSLHYLFLGNPGTGKTTVARILGDLLYQKSIISENKFIEVSRSDLVAGYLGQTAIKTRDVLKSALGGVLFIDEAYSLSKGGENDFGKEAIDEILKFMEDYRDNIVIIFAGYTKEMEEFLQTNSGLRSRIPNKFIFEDYTNEEIVEIGLLLLDKFGYRVNEKFYRDIVIKSYQNSNDNSNGRWIRNFNEKLIRIMSQRVAKSNTTDLNTITDEDLYKF